MASRPDSTRMTSPIFSCSSEVVAAAVEVVSGSGQEGQGTCMGSTSSLLVSACKWGERRNGRDRSVHVLHVLHKTNSLQPCTNALNIACVVLFPPIIIDPLSTETLDCDR